MVSELLFTALRAERCTRLIYHTARLAAHTLRLRIHHRLIRVRRHRLIAHTVRFIRRVRRLHRLTVLIRLIRIRRLHRLPVGICIWAAVRVAVLERLIFEVGAGNGDYQADYPQKESAAEPRAEVLIALGFHKIADNKASYRRANENADKYASNNSGVVNSIAEVHKKHLRFFKLILQYFV